MSWLAERPRRAVAVALVAFVVVMAAVGVGGALAGDDPRPAAPSAVAVQLRRELVAQRRGSVIVGRRLSTQMARVGFWRTRARRAEKALQRAGRKR